MIAASEANDSVALEKFLQRPIDPNLKDLQGWAALHHAARHGHVQNVKLLFEAGAEKDSRANDGRTLLWMAAARGHLEAVQLLIEAGADCNQGRDAGGTPLCLPAHLEVVQMLLEARTDCNKGITDHGITPLHLAARNGQSEVVGFLVEAGADCNQATTDCCITPLQLVKPQSQSATQKKYIVHIMNMKRSTTSVVERFVSTIWTMYFSGFTRTIQLPLRSFFNDPSIPT
eukprot:Skav209812  [mRNA]  locus=scaffold5597:70092:70781:- [translate_table: standard]